MERAPPVGVRSPERSEGPRLLDQVRGEIRRRHYSPRTEVAYVAWVRRYVRFHGLQHPSTLGPEAITSYLTHLATEGHVSASTQNQALAALLFLYVNVLGRPPDTLGDFVHAKRPVRLPVVLSASEVALVLDHLTGMPHLMAALLYGSGLRLLECARLRVKDLDLDRGEVLVRAGKGAKDRVTPLPRRLSNELERHIEKVKRQHEADVRYGAGWVELPHGLGRKWPNAGRQWPWQWVFPATRTYVHDDTGERRRHHFHQTALQRAVHSGVSENLCKLTRWAT